MANTAGLLALDGLDLLAPAVVSAITTQIAAVLRAAQEGSASVSIDGSSSPMQARFGLLVVARGPGRGLGSRAIRGLPTNLSRLLLPCAVLPPPLLPAVLLELLRHGFGAAGSVVASPPQEPIGRLTAPTM